MCRGVREDGGWRAQLHRVSDWELGTPSPFVLKILPIASPPATALLGSRAKHTGVCELSIQVRRVDSVKSKHTAFILAFPRLAAAGLCL